jgi:hypothetical protein
MIFVLTIADACQNIAICLSLWMLLFLSQLDLWTARRKQKTDLNGHVGATNVGFEQVYGGSGMVVGIKRGGCFELHAGLWLVDSEHPF